MALKDLEYNFPKIPKEEIEVERVYSNIDDLKGRIELSKENDEDVKYYFEYIKEYMRIKINDITESDLIGMASSYLSDNSKSAYFYIKHYKGNKGRIIGEIFYHENRFGIFIKKEYRNKGHGKKAMEKFYHHAFLYNMEIRDCDALVLDLKKDDNELEKFFYKCGFELTDTFYNGDKRYHYKKTKYYKFEVCNVQESDLELYNKYVEAFKGSKFRNKFNMMLKNNPRYQYVFLKKTYDDGEIEVVGIGYYKKTNKLPGSFAFVEINPHWKRCGYGRMFMYMLFSKLDYDSIYLSCSCDNPNALKFVYSLKPNNVFYSHGKMIFQFIFVVY